MSDNHLKKGLMWNSLSSLSRYMLQFGGIAVLARLLSPSDYGVIGLMAIFISVAEVLMDGGLCAAVIKKKNATNIDFSTLTTYNLSASILLYVAYFFAAPFVEQYYKCENLSTYLRIYSITILLHALVMGPRTFLIKNFQFKKISLITIVCSFFGLIVAVVMALRGCGVYSLIGQYLSNSALYCLLLFFVSGFKIKLGFSKESFREQFTFGFNTTVANALKSAGENVFCNVIGKFSTLQQTGFYSQGTRLMNVPVGFFLHLIDSTFFPVMSQIHDRVEFRHRITALNAKTLRIIMVLFSLAIVFSKEIVFFLLGEKWMDASMTVTALFVAGLFITWGNIGRNLIKCTGKTFKILCYELLFFVLSLIGLLAFYSFGYKYIVGFFVVLNVFKAVYINVLSCKEIDVSFAEIVRPQFIPLLFCLMFISSIFILESAISATLFAEKFLIFVILVSLYILLFERTLTQKILKKIR